MNAGTEVRHLQIVPDGASEPAAPPASSTVVRVYEAMIAAAPDLCFTGTAAELARDVGLHPDTVDGKLRWMQRAGWIHVDRRPGGNGRSRKLLFTLEQVEALARIGIETDDPDPRVRTASRARDTQSSSSSSTHRDAPRPDRDTTPADRDPAVEDRDGQIELAGLSAAGLLNAAGIAPHDWLVRDFLGLSPELRLEALRRHRAYARDERNPHHLQRVIESLRAEVAGDVLGARIGIEDIIATEEPTRAQRTTPPATALSEAPSARVADRPTRPRPPLAAGRLRRFLADAALACLDVFIPRGRAR